MRLTAPDPGLWQTDSVPCRCSRACCTIWACTSTDSHTHRAYLLCAPLLQVGVVHDVGLRELRLYSDYGRCSRPVYIVENGWLKISKQDIQALTDGDLKWPTLVSSGAIE